MVKLFKSREERFIEALDKSNAKEVQKLLKKGVDPNYKTGDSTWPIVNASWSGNAKIVSLLLAAGANVNAQNDHGLSGLHWAAEKGYADVARVLIDAKIDIHLVTKKNGNTALITATLSGQYEIVEILIKAGSDINYKNYYGNSAILVIDKNNIPEILQLLIDNGANINDTNNDGWTTLHYFCRDNQEKAVRILLDRKADINIINNEGWTALMLSVNNNNDTITELLLDNKADVIPVNSEGHTALQIALIKENSKSVSLLLQHGADFYQREKNNGTLLIDIAYNSKSAALKKLALNHLDTLYTALTENNLAIIKEVISNKGSDSFLQMIKAEMLLQAVNDDKKECIELLLAGQAIKALHSYSTNKNKILEVAVQKGNIELAKKLVDELEELLPYALILAEDNKFKELYEYISKIQEQKELDQKLQAEKKKKKDASDKEMVQVLRDLCRAYAANDPIYLRLEPKAREIGEKLNNTGGMSEMRRIFSFVEGTPGSRTLEMHWNGIGNWRG